MNNVRTFFAFAAACVACAPMGIHAQARIPNVAVLVVVEERPNPDAIATIRVQVNGRRRIENTIVMARRDINRASVFAAISLLNSFRDRHDSIEGAAVLKLRADQVPDEVNMSVEARKYVEYYLHRFANEDGQRRVLIPLRERRSR